MTKKINKKGFTLAELLVVVAIIAVLVAVSIPIFTAQLNKARLATNQANARSAKAAAVAEYLTDATVTKGSYDTVSGLFTKGTAVTGTVTATTDPSTWVVGDKADGDKLISKTYTTIGITLADGKVTEYAFK